MIDEDPIAIARSVADDVQYGRPIPEVSDDVVAQWRALLGSKFGPTHRWDVGTLAVSVAYDQRVQRAKAKQK
jgi:hypothetical protein